VLREDGRVFDIELALDVADEVITAMAETGATWTDIVVGAGRLTVSFGGPSDVAKRVNEIAESLPLQEGWQLEEAEVDQGASERVRGLVELLETYEPEPTEEEVALGAAVEKALADLPSPGSFQEQAGLDQRELDVRKVVRALEWLSKQLPTVDDALRGLFGKAASAAELRLYVNTDPRQRVFWWELRAGAPSDVDFLEGKPAREALGRFFDAPAEQARRIRGVLYDAEMYDDLPGAPRITLDASN